MTINDKIKKVIEIWNEVKSVKLKGISGHTRTYIVERIDEGYMSNDFKHVFSLTESDNITVACSKKIFDYVSNLDNPAQCIDPAFDKLADMIVKKSFRSLKPPNNILAQAKNSVCARLSEGFTPTDISTVINGVCWSDKRKFRMTPDYALGRRWFHKLLDETMIANLRSEDIESIKRLKRDITRREE